MAGFDAASAASLGACLPGRWAVVPALAGTTAHRSCSRRAGDGQPQGTNGVILDKTGAISRHAATQVVSDCLPGCPGVPRKPDTLRKWDAWGTGGRRGTG